jgi:hypothetical protein
MDKSAINLYNTFSAKIFIKSLLQRGRCT